MGHKRTHFKPNETGTGIITYRMPGEKEYRHWRIGCMAWEKPAALRDHLKKWYPEAKFIRGVVIPDVRHKQPKT